MPRYFFDVHDGQNSVDHVGTVFASDDVARVEAVRASGEMIRDFSRNGFWVGQEWSMAVRDQDGRSIAALRFLSETHKLG